MARSLFVLLRSVLPFVSALFSFRLSRDESLNGKEEKAKKKDAAMNNNVGLVGPLMPTQVNFLFFNPVTAPPKHSFEGPIHRLRDVALD